MQKLTLKQTFLVIKQLDSQFKFWHLLMKYSPKPKLGWVKTVRKALGMTAEQLAQKLGVHRMRVVEIERAELNDAVTLRTMRNVAHAMDCELVYAFVPKESLEVILQKQAKKIALARVERVAHSMALENQSIGKSRLQQEVSEISRELLSGSLKHLWNE